MSTASGGRRLAVDLNGVGRVGQALLPLLRRHGIVVAAVRSRTRSYPRDGGVGRRVFVDATSPRYEGADAESWLRRLEEVLEGGTPVVTCNKAPLAIGWTRLVDAARHGGTSISCSGTVGGGTPVLLLLHRLHRSQGIERIDAALNATLGYVCRRVVTGGSIALAVEEAKSAGIAEPDPALDLDGTDSYAKSLIVHNLLFSTRPALSLEPTRPRLRLEEQRILELARSGDAPTVVSTITPRGVAVALASFAGGPRQASEPAVATVRATLRGGSQSTISGPGAGPRATAGAVLGDLLELSSPSRGTIPGVLP